MSGLFYSGQFTLGPKGSPKFLRLTVDPSTVSTPAPIGSFAVNEVTGLWYRKFGASGTNWAPVSGLLRFSPPEQWVFNNVTANTANQALSAQVSTNFDTWKAMRAGSIVGLSTRLTEAVTLATANALVVRVTKNGAAGTLLVASSSGVNPSGGQATQLAGIDTFVAGDLLGIQFTSLVGFTPITTDLEAYLEIEEAA